MARSPCPDGARANAVPGARVPGLKSGRAFSTVGARSQDGGARGHNGVGWWSQRLRSPPQRLGSWSQRLGSRSQRLGSRSQRLGSCSSHPVVASVRVGRRPPAPPFPARTAGSRPREGARRHNGWARGHNGWARGHRGGARVRATRLWPACGSAVAPLRPRSPPAQRVPGRERGARRHNGWARGHSGWARGHNGWARVRATRLWPACGSAPSPRARVPGRGSVRVGRRPLGSRSPAGQPARSHDGRAPDRSPRRSPPLTRPVALSATRGVHSTPLEHP